MRGCPRWVNIQYPYQRIRCTEDHEHLANSRSLIYRCRMQIVRLILLLLITMGLAGCLSNDIILPVVPDASPAGNLQKIHVATTRQLSANPLAIYSGKRSNQLNFADVVISVPSNRKAGTINYPSKFPNLETQFAAVSINTQKTSVDFIGSINRELRQSPPDKRNVFLFVHGYNTNFPAGIFRQAQMRHDFKVEGVAVNFSWASAGRAPAYLYDRDSAQYARDGLQAALGLLARSEVRSIFLLGHSMGGLITMEALRDLSNKNNRAVLSKLRAVVLASPDIDIDVFQSQIAAIKPLPKPFVIFVSSKDRALRISQRVRGGHPRVGEGSDIDLLRNEGIAVIDLSTINDGGDRTNHSTFATSPTLIKMASSGLLSVNTFSSEPSRGTANTFQKSVGALSDLAANIIYLPANVVGVR